MPTMVELVRSSENAAMKMWVRGRGKSVEVDLTDQNALVRVAACDPEYAAQLQDRITEPFAAFSWAFTIGDECLMLERLLAKPDSFAAFMWATAFPKDRPIVRLCVREPEWIVRWAKSFPEDRNFMRDLVLKANDSFVALHWAKTFPEDRESVRDIVDDPEAAFLWTCTFPSSEDLRVMRPIVNGTQWDEIWTHTFRSMSPDGGLNTFTPPPALTYEARRYRSRNRQ